MLGDRDEQRRIESARRAAGFIGIHLLALAVLSYMVLIESGVPVFSVCLGFVTGKFPRQDTFNSFSDVVVTIFYVLVSLRLLFRLAWQVGEMCKAE